MSESILRGSDCGLVVEREERDALCAESDQHVDPFHGRAACLSVVDDLKAQAPDGVGGGGREEDGLRSGVNQEQNSHGEDDYGSITKG